MLQLIQITKFHPSLKKDMAVHYSKPKGFVGRSICYGIMFNDVYYGSIVGGSATLHLDGRNEYFGNDFEINSICNNVFYHLVKKEGKRVYSWQREGYVLVYIRAIFSIRQIQNSCCRWKGALLWHPLCRTKSKGCYTLLRCPIMNRTPKRSVATKAK